MPPDKSAEETPATSTFKLTRRTLKQWLLELCIDEERLRVLKLQNGTVCLQNERTREVYFVE